jgi:hypothetical protein
MTKDSVFFVIEFVWFKHPENYSVLEKLHVFPTPKKSECGMSKTPFIIHGNQCNDAVTNKITVIFQKNNEFLSRMNHVNHLAFATKKTPIKSRCRAHSIEVKKFASNQLLIDHQTVYTQKEIDDD